MASLSSCAQWAATLTRIQRTLQPAPMLMADRQSLAAQDANPKQEDVECLAQLLRTVGSYLDPQPVRSHGRRAPQPPASPQAGWMDAYFVRISTMSKSPQLDSRLRFMLQVRPSDVHMPCSRQAVQLSASPQAGWMDAYFVRISKHVHQEPAAGFAPALPALQVWRV